MPKATLTAASVERLKSPRAGQTDYFDRRLPSFGLRLSYHGTKSWFVMTRLDGKLVRFTLGKHPALSLAEARREARNVMDLTAVGKDPRRLRAESEQKRREERQNTYIACAAEFIEKHAERRLRPSTQREYRRILLGRDTNGWRDRPITQITKRDVLDAIEAIDRRGSPGAAKRVLVYLRKFFNWCAERDIVSMPPTDRIRPPHPEVKRDRVLSEQELRYLLRALEAELTIFGSVIYLLLLTGQRRAEVAGMRWSEIRDLETDAAVWEIPGERTKNKQRHLVPLSRAGHRNSREDASLRRVRLHDDGNHPDFWIWQSEGQGYRPRQRASESRWSRQHRRMEPARSPPNHGHYDEREAQHPAPRCRSNC